MARTDFGIRHSTIQLERQPDLNEEIEQLAAAQNNQPHHHHHHHHHTEIADSIINFV